MSYTKPPLRADAYPGRVHPLNDYKNFRTYPGLPPDGEPGTFLGFDADHCPWVLTWQKDIGCWGAVGFCDKAQLDYPAAEYRSIEGEHADFIKQWSFSPVCAPMPQFWEAATMHDLYGPEEEWGRRYMKELYKKTVLKKSDWGI